MPEEFSVRWGLMSVRFDVWLIDVSEIEITQTEGSFAAVHTSPPVEVAISEDFMSLTIQGKPEVLSRASVTIPEGTVVHISSHKHLNAIIGNIEKSTLHLYMCNGTVVCGRVRNAEIEANGDSIVSVEEVTGEKLNILAGGCSEVTINSGYVLDFRAESYANSSVTYKGGAKFCHYLSYGEFEIKLISE